jgi:EmrB/QacA subfamily drug resistance transporter
VIRRTRRSRHVADLLDRIWGNSLPLGPNPFDAIAEDAIWIDDGPGRREGVIVRSLGISRADLVAILLASRPFDAVKRVARRWRRRSLTAAPAMRDPRRRTERRCDGRGHPLGAWNTARVSTTARDRSWRPIALLVAGAFFMENLDGTIIATAAPRMAHSFGVRPVDVNVVITAYLLTLAVLIPVSGWLADRYGARTVFGTAIAVFTTASGLCAVSGSLGELTVMRVLQGVGGAMMVPVGRLVVLRSTKKIDLIDAMAYLTWPALAAPVLAPAVGGVLTTYASWRWIFVINLPLGVVALIFALRMVPNVPNAGHAKLDWLGFVWTGVGLTAVVYGLERATADNVAWALVGAAVGIGLVLLAIAVRHLRRAAHPLLDLSALRIPTFRTMMVGGSTYRLAIGAVPFLLPLMFQDEFGWSPVKSGLLVIFVFIGNIGIKPTTGPLLRRLGFRAVLIGAAVAGAVTLALCAFVTAGTPLPLIAVLLLASGSFRSIGFTAYNTIAFADVSNDGLSSANTLASTAQQLTMGLGVAAGALALRAGSPIGARLAVGDPAHRPYAVAFLLIALIAVVSVFDSVRLPANAGAAINPGRSAAAEESEPKTARP